MSYQSRPSARLRLEVETLEDRVTPTTLVVGQNINTSAAVANDQAEGTIAKNPAAPNQLFAASVDYSTLQGPDYERGLHGARSSNTGATWTQSKVATGKTDSLPAALGDPSAAWDEFGNLFVTYATKDLVQQGTTTPGGTPTTVEDSTKSWPANRWAGHWVTITNPTPDGPLHVTSITGNDANTLFVNPNWMDTSGQPMSLPAGLNYRVHKPNGEVSVEVIYSTNGGATFQYLATLTQQDGDNPSIAVGPGNVPGTGSVWVTYTETTIPHKIVAQGATVTGLGTIGGFGAAQYPFSGIPPAPGPMGASDVAIGPQGKVAVAAQSKTTPARIWANLDADGVGAGPFSFPVLVTESWVGWRITIPAQPNRGVSALPRLAWDRNAAPNGKLYLSYAEQGEFALPDTDIFVARSFDGGRTWFAGYRVHAASGKSQFMGDVAVDQTTGKLAVVWHDARETPSNAQVKIYGTVSEDFGITFLPEVAIAAWLSVPQVAPPPHNEFDYGDYMGIAFHAGAFHPVWADNSNSTGDNINGGGSKTDLYTARVDVVPGGGGGMAPGGGDFFGGGSLLSAARIPPPTKEGRLRTTSKLFSNHEQKSSLFAFLYERRRSLIDELVAAGDDSAFNLLRRMPKSRA